MAKQASVKLSSDFLEEARREAGVVHRSVGAQVEYWARLGRALENAPGFGMDRVRQALHGGLRLEDLQRAEQDAVFDYLSAELDAPSPRIRAHYAAIGAEEGAAGSDARGRLVRRDASGGLKRIG
jgi:hypothetical protein